MSVSEDPGCLIIESRSKREWEGAVVTLEGGFSGSGGVSESRPASVSEGLREGAVVTLEE